MRGSHASVLLVAGLTLLLSSLRTDAESIEPPTCGATYGEGCAHGPKIVVEQPPVEVVFQHAAPTVCCERLGCLKRLFCCPHAPCCYTTLAAPPVSVAPAYSCAMPTTYAYAAPAVQSYALVAPAAQSFALAAPAAQSFTLAAPAAQSFALAPAAQSFALAAPAAQSFTLAAPAAQSLALAAPTAQSFTLAAPAAQTIALAPNVAQGFSVAPTPCPGLAGAQALAVNPLANLLAQNAYQEAEQQALKAYAESLRAGLAQAESAQANRIKAESARASEGDCCDKIDALIGQVKEMQNAVLASQKAILNHENRIQALEGGKK